MEATEDSPGGTGRAKTRYEVIVRSTAPDGTDMRQLADMDMDRVPDPEGGTRLLVDLDEAARLVESGFEVTIVQAVPPGPLDSSLIMDDAAAAAWLEERLGGRGQKDEE